jgi:predicted PurR-regulated permease PerM
MTASWVRRAVIVVIALAVIAAALLLAVRIPRTIALFLIAAFVAFGAYPLVKQLERWMPRPAAISVVYAVLIGALVILALVVVPITYDQVVLLIGGAPQYVVFAQDAIANAEGWARHLVGNRVPLPSFTEMESEVANRVSAFATVLVEQLGSIVVSAVSALIIGTSALILSVFFLLHGGEVRDGILAFVPPSRRAKIDALLRELAGVFGHFVAGQALLCAIVGGAVWILLAPAHFKFALLVAVVCALGYAVPFVGMLVAQVVAALLAIPQGTGMVVWVTVAIFVVSRVADNILVPRIMARSVGVSPIAVMFAVFAGGELFGLPGLILGIPAAALLKVLFGYFVQPYIVRMQTSPDADGDVHVAVDAPPSEAVVVTVAPAAAQERPAV